MFFPGFFFYFFLELFYEIAREKSCSCLLWLSSSTVYIWICRFCLGTKHENSPFLALMWYDMATQSTTNQAGGMPFQHCRHPFDEVPFDCQELIGTAHRLRPWVPQSWSCWFLSFSKGAVTQLQIWDDWTSRGKTDDGTRSRKYAVAIGASCSSAG